MAASKEVMEEKEAEVEGVGVMVVEGAGEANASRLV